MYRTKVWQYTYNWVVSGGGRCKMDFDQPPWPDAERIPEKRVREVFRSPPAMPARFVRSALVVGSRGAGKTILFRYLKDTHTGFATHIYLSTEFASLTKAGHGPLAPRYPENIEKQLSGKATSLLALSISDRLQRKGLSVPIEHLLRCLPEKYRPNVNKIDAQWINDTRELVNIETLAGFEGVAEASPLVSFVSESGDINRNTCGPLLLLLDRADAVPSPALLPAFELLDQAGPYTTLLATRPGIGGEPLSRIARVVVPGDSYDVMHLGLYPRSTQWINLVKEALEAQFDSKFTTLPESIRNSIIVFSRDSIKVAVELVAGCISDDGICTDNELISLIEDLRDSRLTTAQRTLQTYIGDFRDSVRNIREQVLEQHSVLTPGVLVTIKRRLQPSLLPERTHLDLFLDAALRTWAVCMPEGQQWVPGLRPIQVEIPPLLIWTKKEKLWANWDSPAEITLNVSELTGYGGPRSYSPTLFIAYRMTFDESIEFRNSLEEFVHSYPYLSDVRVQDGNVPLGAKWPETIRKRINKSNIVVGDIEGMRPDVLFELGFAYGQGKVYIPVFKTFPENMEDIPDWLIGRQTGYYGDAAGIERIVTSIVTHLSDPEFIKPPAPPQPIPALVVWLRQLDWNKHALEQFRTLIHREGLNVEVYKDSALTNERNIRRAASAGLLVLSLDGTEMDGLMHYIAGAVVSRPSAGRGQKSLCRNVIILEENLKKHASLSLQKCEDSEETVVLCSPEDLVLTANKFINNYTRWVRQGSLLRR